MYRGNLTNRVKYCVTAYNKRGRKRGIRKGRSMWGAISRRLNLCVASLVLTKALAVVTPLLAAERVTFPSVLRQADTMIQLSGYLYRPDGPGPFPAVVLLHGCGGLLTSSGKIRANARFWAEHLRDHGYVAVLVDSFIPRGIDEVCTGRHTLSAVRDRADDARGALQFMRQRADVQAARVGLIGWSNGGAAVLSVMFDKGAPQRDFRAALAFYPSCMRTISWRTRLPALRAAPRAHWGQG